jgi:hypothetical protein
MSLCGICRAFRADALDLDGRGGGFEAPRPGGLIDRHADPAVAHLEHPAAGRADQELGGGEPVMRVLGPAAVEHMGAADEGREALDLVHEALGGQKFQRPIDGGRGGRTTILAQPVEEIIGAGGAGIIQNVPEDEPTLIRQPQLPPVTESFRLIKQALGFGSEHGNRHSQL